MWIQLGSGRVELVLHEAHITRLLSDGGVQVEPPVSEQEESREDASTVNNGKPNTEGKTTDLRPQRGKSGVRRSGHSRRA